MRDVINIERVTDRVRQTGCSTCLIPGATNDTETGYTAASGSEDMPYVVISTADLVIEIGLIFCPNAALLLL